MPLAADLNGAYVSPMRPILLLLLFAASGFAGSKVKPVLDVDLRQYGHEYATSENVIEIYTEIEFLPDDQLFLAVLEWPKNKQPDVRRFNLKHDKLHRSSVEPHYSLLLFQLKRDKLLDSPKDAHHPGRTQHLECASGERFGIYKVGYKHMWIDMGDENGPYDRATLQVFDSATKKRVFDLTWNPGHGLAWAVHPVLSPDGHRVALIMDHKLRVYEF
jgi:hypothetical protein